jgi:hypothetical protein
MASAFSRSKAVFSAIAAALALGSSMQTIIQSGKASYSSRGHGQGKYSGKKRANSSGKTYPLYSARECARRVRQMQSHKNQ